MSIELLVDTSREDQPVFMLQHGNEESEAFEMGQIGCLAVGEDLYFSNGTWVKKATVAVTIAVVAEEADIELDDDDGDEIGEGEEDGEGDEGVVDDEPVVG